MRPILSPAPPSSRRRRSDWRRCSAPPGNSQCVSGGARARHAASSVGPIRSSIGPPCVLAWRPRAVARNARPLPGGALMDLRLLAAEPLPAERDAIDAVVGAAETSGNRVARADRNRRHLLLPALRAAQRRVGWVSEGALGYTSRRLDVPPADAYGVASFYALLALEKRPADVLHVCTDLACRLRAVELGPKGILREITDSRLLGRGGAAFPTGAKWEAVAGQPAHPHYLVCNADESEPGTFKDRILMECDPFALVEAMTIAAFATGCERGFVYVRAEYPLAHERLENAFAQARARGLLGDDVAGAGFAFDLELRIGAGAYVCGEETALFQSIEGYRGEPRNKPPFPVEVGLFGKPTVVNNVETLFNVLDVVSETGRAYAETGTEGSTGTRLFCVSGHVAKPGPYEVPLGTTLRELLDLAQASPPKAVLLGGAAGAFVRPDQLDLPLTFEDTRAAGVTLGSGVVIVYDEAADL